MKKSVIVEFIILTVLVYLCFPSTERRAETIGMGGIISHRIAGLAGIQEARAEAPAAREKTCGIYSLYEPNDILKEFPNVTTYLFYVEIDDESTVDYGIRIHDEWKAQKNNKHENIHPQVALELGNMSLRKFLTEIKDSNSKVRKNIRKFADAFKDDTGPVYLRPFSEMNDASNAGTSWKLGRGPNANKAQEFANAWMALVDAFREAGLKNAEFHFNVLAAKSVGIKSDAGNIELTFKALDLIKPGYVDALGFNVYSRPRGAGYAKPGDRSQNGKCYAEYVPFSELVQPWLDRLKKSKHAELPSVVGEMGASSQGTDREKAKWISQAFEFCRANKFYMVTYFNWRDTNWAAEKGSDADKFLKAALLIGL